MTLAAEYRKVINDEALQSDLRQLVRLSIAEDLDVAVDWTTVTLIDIEQRGRCHVVPRCTGVAAGIELAPIIIDEFDADLDVSVAIQDGELLQPGRPVATVSGSARDLLTSERVLLNILSRLCGVATLTKQYADAIHSSGVRLYDTRKTTPGWRRLEKYAVQCGGGHNHRTGLFDGFLIKDNHLALGRSRLDVKAQASEHASHGDEESTLSASEAAQRAVQMRGAHMNQLCAPEIVEIEVDDLAQLEQVLPTGIDIVLVDNFSIDDLRAAVAMRDRICPTVQLEASGGVTIDTIAAIAATGVDRISCGALTHQAVWLDLGMDWADGSAS
ncbi:MAG: nicotinate-nucleotide diphosphorylase [Planctomycetota bacterium]